MSQRAGASGAPKDPLGTLKRLSTQLGWMVDQADALGVVELGDALETARIEAERLIAEAEQAPLAPES